MKLFRVLFENSLGLVVLAIGIAVISAFMGISLIVLINRMIEEQYYADLGTYFWYFVCLLICLVISGVVSQIMLSRIGLSIVYRLRLAIINRILVTDIETLERVGEHRLYAVLANDINTIANAFRRFPVATYNTLLFIGGMAYLGYLSLPLFMLTIVIIFLALVVNRIIARKMSSLYRDVRVTQDTLYKQYQASIDGRHELRLDNARRQHLFYQLFKPAANHSREVESRAETWWAINNSWVAMVVFILMGMVTFLGIQQFKLPLNVVTGYILVIMFLRTPISMMVDMLPSLVDGSVSLKKISELELHKYHEDSLDNLPNYAVSEFKQLELDGVSYLYPDDNKQTSNSSNNYTFSLRPLTLNIFSGEVLFIIGGNGSGKSTFFKILTGLYPSHSGNLFLNNQRINAENIDWYRNHFITVLSDFYLFDHIAIDPHSSVNMDRANHYLARLKMDKKVQLQNGVLSTKKLSQGQRKRLALLAVYLSPRPIVLLDEWAADQDPVFREVFYNEILPELKAQGKTIIAITHDDKYFDCADRVLSFDSGTMEEVK